jgi:3-dehydroquinate synthase
MNRNRNAGSLLSVQSVEARAEAAVLRAELRLEIEFPVTFTRDVFHPDNPVLADSLRRAEPARRQTAFFVVGSAVAAARPQLERSIETYALARPQELELAGRPLVIEGSSPSKSVPANPDWLRSRLCHAQLGRGDHVVAVGGGALLDVVGLAASTLQRGLRLTRVPTTALAQAECSLALRNGVDFFGRRDWLTAFSAPFSVVLDSRFLETLPRRERLSGAAAAARLGLARDADLLRWLDARAETVALSARGASLETLIARCVRQRLSELAPSSDASFAPRLELGGWLAARLESLSGCRLSYGESLAIGLAADALASVELAGLPQADADYVLALLEKLGFELWDPALELVSADGRRLALEGLEEARLRFGPNAGFPVIENLGRCRLVDRYDEAAAARALDALAHRRSAA